jgi:uncharacterized membrane protein
MLLIGVLIVVAAAAFAGAVVSENWGGSTYTVHGFGHVLGHLTLAQIFLSAVALTAIFFLGLWVASVSSRIHRRSSSRRRAEARATREERDTLLAERDRLASELDAERAAHPVMTQEVPTSVTLPAMARTESVMGPGDYTAQPVSLVEPSPRTTAVIR